MTTAKHTAITTGAAANAATFNAPLSQLDTAIVANAAAIVVNAANIAGNTAEIVTARSSYTTLDSRLDALTLATGNATTLTNGVTNAGQKVIVVDATTGFLAGAPISYTLISGAVESNVIGTVDGLTQITCVSNVGATGIANNTYVSIMPLGSVLVTGVIPAATGQAQTFVSGVVSDTLAERTAGAGITIDSVLLKDGLVDGVNVANAALSIFNVLDYGAYADDTHAAETTVALQAAIAAATAAGGGIVNIPIGTYAVSGQLVITRDNIRIVGSGMNTLLRATTDLGANALLYFENTTSATAELMHCAVVNLYMRVDGNSSSGIEFVRAIEPLVKNCYIRGNYDAANGAQTGIVMDGEYVIGVSATWGGGLRVFQTRVSGLKYGIVLKRMATACIIDACWIVGSAWGPPQTGSVGIGIDATSGQGSVIVNCDLEGWAIGIQDDGHADRVVYNRFEQVTQPIAQAAGLTTTAFVIMGNTYGNCGASSIVVPSFGIQLDPSLPITFGSHTTGDTTVDISTVHTSKSARLQFTDGGDSASPVLIMGAYGSGATNAFAETSGAYEANLSTVAYGKLKVGTAASSDLDFYTNKVRRGGFDGATGNFEISGGAWDSAHLVIGAYHLWVDATGDLRIKSSAPTSGTDGAVVGDQAA
jgi:hypothetical protein